jgi:hypothetical protein
MREKFLACAAENAADPERAAELIESIDELDDVRELVEANLRPARARPARRPSSTRGTPPAAPPPNS